MFLLHKTPFYKALYLGKLDLRLAFFGLLISLKQLFNLSARYLNQKKEVLATFYVCRVDSLWLLKQLLQAVSDSRIPLIDLNLKKPVAALFDYLTAEQLAK